MTTDITNDPQYYNMLKSKYKKTFTEEEALANIAFLSTPIGQSINKKNVKLMGDVMKQSQTMAMQMMQDPKRQKKLMTDIQTIIEPLMKNQK